MRDDVAGIAALRTSGTRPQFGALTPAWTQAPGAPSFASVLTRAGLSARASAPARPALPGIPLTTPRTPGTPLAPVRTAGAAPTPATPGASTALKQGANGSLALTQSHAPYVSPMKRPTLAPPSTVARGPASTVGAPPTPAAPTTPRPAAVTRPPSTVDTTPPALPQVIKPAPLPSTAASQAAAAMALGSYPHPNQDNGRGMHWIPTTRQSPADIDRFVSEAQRMGVKWVTFLNKGASVGDNDYLVTKLAAAGIEPVMRVFSDTLQPIQGDVEGMVRHYTALGVHYFQPFNEPNVDAETPDGRASVDHYLDAWIPVAKAIVRGGGLPGFGSMAPGGDFDDQKFLAAALDGIKARGEVHVLDTAWLSMHNYTWNHPIVDRGDGDGFFKFRAYHTAVQAALGRDLPIIGTEGGTFVGQREDARMPAVTSSMQADWTQQSFTYMRDKREPYMFASSVWTIADLAGGGSDPRFEAQALFKQDGTTSAIVGSLQALG